MRVTLLAGDVGTEMCCGTTYGMIDPADCGVFAKNIQKCLMRVKRVEGADVSFPASFLLQS